MAQSMMQTFRPLLDMDLGVVAPGENERNPRGGQNPVGQTLMVAVTAKVAVEQLRETQLLGQSDEQGDVIDSFVQQRRSIHPAIMRSLPGNGTWWFINLQSGRFAVRREFASQPPNLQSVAPKQRPSLHYLRKHRVPRKIPRICTNFQRTDSRKALLDLDQQTLEID